VVGEIDKKLEEMLSGGGVFADWYISASRPAAVAYTCNPTTQESEIRSVPV
jgi:hypothetical protein